MKGPCYYDARNGQPVDCLPPTRGPFVILMPGHVIMAASAAATQDAMADRIEWLASPEHRALYGC